MSDPIEGSDKIDPKKRGLGRGLNALFGDEETDSPGGMTAEIAGESGANGRGPALLGIDQLEPGIYQPRRTFTDSSLAELADSIAAHGVLQPLIVRAKEGFADTYEIIAGERRWRAAQLAQLHEVPVIIKELSNEQALEIALIENLQREDLNPVEEALGYRQLMQEFGHTQEKAAKILGKSRSHVANTLRLLTLPAPVLAFMRDGKLSAGHARALITAEKPEELANLIVNQGLSVREAERLAAGDKAGRPGGSGRRTPPAKDVDTLALEKEMTNNLGMKVAIDLKKDGKGGRAGQVKVSFKDLDQLDILLRLLSAAQNRGVA